MTRTLLLLLLALALPATALAEDEDAESTAPPAVEAEVPARGAAQPPDAGSTTWTRPRPSAASLITYTDHRLSVRTQTSYSGGDSYAVTRYWGWRYSPFLGVATTEAVTTPVVELTEWLVFQGNTRLTVPKYLTLVGRKDEARRLNRGIIGRQTASWVLAGVAMAGLTTSMVGTFSYLQARGYEQRVASVGAAVGGGFLAAFSVGFSWGFAADARRLRWDFDRSIESGVQADVKRYNTDLRTRLGLSEPDVRDLRLPGR